MTAGQVKILGKTYMGNGKQLKNCRGKSPFSKGSPGELLAKPVRSDYKIPRDQRPLDILYPSSQVLPRVRYFCMIHIILLVGAKSFAGASAATHDSNARHPKHGRPIRILPSLHSMRDSNRPIRIHRSHHPIRIRRTHNLRSSFRSRNLLPLASPAKH
jgi:hypothetical protein